MTEPSMTFPASMTEPIWIGDGEDCPDHPLEIVHFVPVDEKEDEW